MSGGWGEDGHWEHQPGELARLFVPNPGARFIGWGSEPQVSEAHAAAMFAGMEPLPFAGWRWPQEPTLFYAGADTIGYRNPNRGGGFDVSVAARRPEALAHIADIRGLEVSLVLESDPAAQFRHDQEAMREFTADVTRPEHPMSRLFAWLMGR